MDRFEKFAQSIQAAREARGAAIMGVLNVTPDSFSDGGECLSYSAACARADEMIAQGADILDIGGESTRPGAAAVPAVTQVARIREVVEYAARRTCVSVDTSSPEVAEACMLAGAHAINDVRCGSDADLLRVAAAGRAAYVLSHVRGVQSAMPGFSTPADELYAGDVVAAVIADLQAATARACAVGIPQAALLFDPGLGFSKTAPQSLDLLRNTHELVRACEGPVVVGASRKSFLRWFGAAEVPRDRLGASLAAALIAVGQGAQVVRVHDVAATREALSMQFACMRPPAAHGESGAVGGPS